MTDMLRAQGLRDPERAVMEKAYARWAPVYDALCGPFFLSRRLLVCRLFLSLELFNREYWKLPVDECARIGLAKMKAAVADE